MLNLWDARTTDVIPSVSGKPGLQNNLRLGKRLGIGKLSSSALAGVAQWIEGRPENRKVAGLIPGQGTCMGCRPGPQLGA